jgi:hypothetical protein
MSEKWLTAPLRQHRNSNSSRSANLRFSRHVMNDRALGDLGAPDLKLEGLQIWVHGRQFPDLHDYWDGNWLRVTAHCGGSGASVFTTGSIARPDRDAIRGAMA